MDKDSRKYTKVVCPRCGKAIPVRILDLHGSLRYSISCKNCKEISEVEIRNNTESTQDR